MPEIHYKTLEKYLNDLKDPEKILPVYLIYGEESLYKSALESLLAVLIPDSDQSLNYEPIDGKNENIQEAIQRINTFSLLSGIKVVAICDAQLFYAKQDDARLLDEDTTRLLEEAIEKGFPKQNHLVITADVVDKRRKLFQTIRHAGMIIDCSVPKGDRMADRSAQEAVLKERMTEILREGGKRMGKNAYKALNEMTGFDLRTFSNNLENLVNYVGTREEITVNDVQTVLKRTKIDPMYDFTNAVTDKNIEKAFFYMDSLLSSGDIDHPLQLLAATLKQFRSLLMIKDFMESPHGGSWHSGDTFTHFKTRVMPAIQAFDKNLLDQLKDWEERVSDHEKVDTKQGKRKHGEKKKLKKGQATTDLVIAKNPNNPYPVYQMLKKSERFTKQEIIAALEHLKEADLRLKSTGQSQKIVMEDMILNICGKA